MEITKCLSFCILVAFCLFLDSCLACFLLRICWNGMTVAEQRQSEPVQDWTRLLICAKLFSVLKWTGKLFHREAAAKRNDLLPYVVVLTCGREKNNNPPPLQVKWSVPNAMSFFLNFYENFKFFKMFKFLFFKGMISYRML
jgi:hypothetical protein